MSNMTIYWHQFVVVSRIEEDVAYEWSMGEVDQLFCMQWLKKILSPVDSGND